MYLIAWEFQANDGREAEFESVYGPDGHWARLFRRSKGYLGTELLRSLDQPGAYYALDRWATEAAFSQFCNEYQRETQELDRRHEGLATREARFGAFQAFQASSSSLIPQSLQRLLS